MERLLKPHKHLVAYHGVLAPAAELSSQVVPEREEERNGASGCAHAAGVAAMAELPKPLLTAKAAIANFAK